MTEQQELFAIDGLAKRPKEPSVDYLLAEAFAILDRAFQEHHASAMLPLFSGGNDSMCACHVASQHRRFGRTVFNIDTGTGAIKNREHVERVCQKYGWALDRRKSPDQEKDSYEAFIREQGFPGPGMHTWVYVRLKQRVLAQLVQEHKAGNRPVALISGVRMAESARRMGHAKAITRGNGVNKKTGDINDPRWLWVAPCILWTARDKAHYMDEMGLPRNPFTGTLCMSGECFCGAYGKPGEIEKIRQYAPDVAENIDRLAAIARECGKHDKWGTPPPQCAPIDPSQLEIPGMMCWSCQAKADAPIGIR